MSKRQKKKVRSSSYAKEDCRSSSYAKEDMKRTLAKPAPSKRPIKKNKFQDIPDDCKYVMKVCTSWRVKLTFQTSIQAFSNRFLHPFQTWTDQSQKRKNCVLDRLEQSWTTVNTETPWELARARVIDGLQTYWKNRRSYWKKFEITPEIPAEETTAGGDSSEILTLLREQNAMLKKLVAQDDQPKKTGNMTYMFQT